MDPIAKLTGNVTQTFEIYATDKDNRKKLGRLRNFINYKLGFRGIIIDYIREDADTKTGLIITGKDILEETITEILKGSIFEKNFSVQEKQVEAKSIKKSGRTEAPLEEVLKALAKNLSYRTPTRRELETSLPEYLGELVSQARTYATEMCRAASEPPTKLSEALYDILKELGRQIGYELPARKILTRNPKRAAEVGSELARNLAEQSKKTNTGSSQYTSNLEEILFEVAKEIDIEKPDLERLRNPDEIINYKKELLDKLRIKIPTISIKYKKEKQPEITNEELKLYHYYDIIVENRKSRGQLRKLNNEIKEYVTRKGKDKLDIVVEDITKTDPVTKTVTKVGLRVKNTTLKLEEVKKFIREKNLIEMNISVYEIANTLIERPGGSRRERDIELETERLLVAAKDELRLYVNKFGERESENFVRVIQQIDCYPRLIKEVETRKEELAEASCYISHLLDLIKKINTLLDYRPEIDLKVKKDMAKYHEEIENLLNERKDEVAKEKRILEGRLDDTREGLEIVRTEALEANRYATALEALLHELATNVGYISPLQFAFIGEQDFVRYRTGLLEAIQKKQRQKLEITETTLKEQARLLEVKLGEELRLEKTKLEEAEAKLKENQEREEELKREKQELENLVKEGSLGILTAEEILVEAFKRVYSPELNRSIEEYNILFPEGIPENLITAQTDLRELVNDRLGKRLIEVDQKLNDKGLTIEQLSEQLRSYTNEFEETEYAQEHQPTYKIALLAEKTFQHKREETLNTDERFVKELIMHYNDAKKEHYRIKEEAQKLLSEIDEIRLMHEKTLVETLELRKRIPLNVTFGCFSYHVQEDEGYRLRFLIPTNNQNFRENAALDFSLALASTLRGRSGRITTGQLRDCHYIDLTYNQTTPERLTNLIDTTRKELKVSDLVKVGAKIEIKYFGELRL